MMGSDIERDAIECEIHRAGILAMRKRAAELRPELCASRGLTPSQACQAGCSICGVADAIPARCEFCAHGVTEMVDAHRPAAACGPQAQGVGSAPHAVRQTCRCGLDGCADGACPGRSA